MPLANAKVTYGNRVAWVALDFYPMRYVTATDDEGYGTKIKGVFAKVVGNRAS